MKQLEHPPGSRNRQSMWIGGRPVESVSGESFADFNPATGEELSQIPLGTPEDVDRAVAAARSAFDEGPWGRMAAVERGRIIARIAQLLRDRLEEIALLESRDNGKTIATARDDVARTANLYEFFAGAPT